MTDGKYRVLREPNAAYAIPFGSGSVIGWGCVSHDCKSDLTTLQGNLNGPRYQRYILEIVVVPHFVNHALSTKPVFWRIMLDTIERVQ